MRVITWSSKVINQESHDPFPISLESRVQSIKQDKLHNHAKKIKQWYVDIKQIGNFAGYGP